MKTIAKFVARNQFEITFAVVVGFLLTIFVVGCRGGADSPEAAPGFDKRPAATRSTLRPEPVVTHHPDNVIIKDKEVHCTISLDETKVMPAADCVKLLVGPAQKWWGHEKTKLENQQHLESSKEASKAVLEKCLAKQFPPSTIDKQRKAYEERNQIEAIEGKAVKEVEAFTSAYDGYDWDCDRVLSQAAKDGNTAAKSRLISNNMAWMRPAVAVLKLEGLMAAASINVSDSDWGFPRFRILVELYDSAIEQMIDFSELGIDAKWITTRFQELLNEFAEEVAETEKNLLLLEQEIRSEADPKKKEEKQEALLGGKNVRDMLHSLWCEFLDDTDPEAEVEGHKYRVPKYSVPEILQKLDVAGCAQRETTQK